MAGDYSHRRGASPKSDDRRPEVEESEVTSEEIDGLNHVTRRRWDMYCLGATLCLAAASLAVDSNPRAWSAPILGLALWCFRFSIHRHGIPSRAIRDFPPASRRLIVWIAFSIGIYPALLLAWKFFRIPDWVLLTFVAVLSGRAFLLAHRADLVRSSARL